MKKTDSIILIVALALMGCGGGKKNAQSEELNGAVLNKNFVAETDSTFFMLADEKLPQKVDLEQDISKLNYQNLRLLRSYVYAIHGHWFMEGDLNSFFTNHTDWYYNLADSIWNNQDDNLSAERQEKMYAYNSALMEDYPKAYSFIELTGKEREFVQKIDARMRKMMAQKNMDNGEGLMLLNPNLLTNWFQVYQPDPRMLQMLAQHNVAMEPTSYQQLFNVYENNEYMSMPSFLTTDVMLQAYHMYFSYMLKSLEAGPLRKALVNMFRQLYEDANHNLSVGSELQEETQRHILAFSVVGLALLGEDNIEMRNNTQLGNLQEVVRQELALIKEGTDESSPLFQTTVEFPYSLFKPRGHYTRSKDSQRYFQAMMWLQKGCYFCKPEARLLQTISIATALNRVPRAKQELTRINQALTFLMGEPDNVSILDLADYMHEAGMSTIEHEISTDDRNKIDKWLIAQFKKHNRIKPKQVVSDPDQLNILPQRYTLDGEILGTMYDPEKEAARAYPTGLDVMDIMGVPTATALLKTHNEEFPWQDYEKERGKMQKRLSDFSDWDATMYSKWMKSLLVLQKTDKGQPAFMQSKAWKLKSLNSALASWALLKHDAILYAEQPMAAECGGAGMPDPQIKGYVEPNLAFWEEMRDMLAHAEGLLKNNNLQTVDLTEKSRGLMDMIEFCIRATKAELKGQELTKEDYVYLQHMGSSLEWFTLSVIEPGTDYAMWNDLKGPDRCIAQVADVFTRNIMGCKKDGILYEATGLANAIYVVVEIGGELYLTRGGTYSYYEFVRPLGNRLTDEEWQEMLFKGMAPAIPEWFAPMLLGKPVDLDQRFVYSTGC